MSIPRSRHLGPPRLAMLVVFAAALAACGGSHSGAASAFGPPTTNAHPVKPNALIGLTPTPGATPYNGPSGITLYGTPATPYTQPQAHIVVIQIDCQGTTCVNQPMMGAEGWCSAPPCSSGAGDFITELGGSSFASHILGQYLQNWKLDLVASITDYVPFITLTNGISTGTLSAPIDLNDLASIRQKAAALYPKATLFEFLIPGAVSFCYDKSKQDCTPGSTPSLAYNHSSHTYTCEGSSNTWPCTPPGWTLPINWRDWCGFHSGSAGVIIEGCAGDDTDSILSTLSHEIFEQMTDYLGSATNDPNYTWYSGGQAQEIGDICEGVANLVNLYYGGFSHMYRIQSEYSNHESACYPKYDMPWVAPQLFHL